jgi:hypothetical protein
LEQLNEKLVTVAGTNVEPSPKQLLARRPANNRVGVALEFQLEEEVKVRNSDRDYWFDAIVTQVHPFMARPKGLNQQSRPFRQVVRVLDKAKLDSDQDRTSLLIGTFTVGGFPCDETVRLRQEVEVATKKIRECNGQTTALTQEVKRLRQQVWEQRQARSLDERRLGEALRRIASEHPQSADGARQQAELDELDAQESELIQALAEAKRERAKYHGIAQSQGKKINDSCGGREGIMDEIFPLTHPAGEIFFRLRRDDDQGESDSTEHGFHDGSTGRAIDPDDFESDFSASPCGDRPLPPPAQHRLGSRGDSDSEDEVPANTSRPIGIAVGHRAPCSSASDSDEFEDESLEVSNVNGSCDFGSGQRLAPHGGVGRGLGGRPIPAPLNFSKTEEESGSNFSSPSDSGRSPSGTWLKTSS